MHCIRQILFAPNSQVCWDCGFQFWETSSFLHYRHIPKFTNELAGSFHHYIWSLPLLPWFTWMASYHALLILDHHSSMKVLILHKASPRSDYPPLNYSLIKHINNKTWNTRRSAWNLYDSVSTPAPGQFRCLDICPLSLDRYVWSTRLSATGRHRSRLSARAEPFAHAQLGTWC